MIKKNWAYGLGILLAFTLFFKCGISTFASDSAAQDTSASLTFQYPPGFLFFAPEAGLSADVEPITAEEINLENKEIYNNLSPEAKQLLTHFISTSDSELATYQDNTIDPGSVTQSINSNYYVADSVGSALTVLSTSLKKLKLPIFARYSFMAVGSSMAIAGADGPLPVGDLTI